MNASMRLTIGRWPCGADDPAGIDNGLNFGGAYLREVDFLDFPWMSTAAS